MREPQDQSDDDFMPSPEELTVLSKFEAQRLAGASDTDLFLTDDEVMIVPYLIGHGLLVVDPTPNMITAWTIGITLPGRAVLAQAKGGPRA